MLVILLLITSIVIFSNLSYYKLLLSIVLLTICSLVVNQYSNIAGLEEAVAAPPGADLHRGGRVPGPIIITTTNDNNDNNNDNDDNSNSNDNDNDRKDY